MSRGSNFSLAIVAALISAGAAGCFASPAKATGLIDKCEANASRKALERCCTLYVRQHGKPLWMRETGSSCNQTIVCNEKVAGAVLCKLRIPDDNRQHSTPPPPSPPPNTNLSDARLKHNIHRVGSTVFGLGLYDFEYNDRLGVYEGVMAQEVLRVMPEAVLLGADGFYRVNYGMLSIAMKRLH